MAKTYSTPVISPLARFAFCNLESPEQCKDNQTGRTYEEFNVTLLIPKTDPDIQRLVGAYNEVMAAKYGQDQSKWPQFRNPTFRDGDTDPTYRDASKYPGFQGMWVVKATTNSQPGLLDERKQPVITKGVLYSGCWGYCQLTAADYDQNGNQGIKFYLNNVMKFKDDARMGSNGQTAEQAFAAFPAAAAPAAPMGRMPGAPAAPMQQPGMMPQGTPMGGTLQSAPMSQPMQPAGPAAPVMPTAAPGAPMAAPAFPGAAAGYNPNPLG